LERITHFAKLSGSHVYRCTFCHKPAIHFLFSGQVPLT
jgi:hypothetical protein